MEIESLSVKEVANRLKVTPQMVYNMIRREDLPAFKVGKAVRILSRDLDSYVECQKSLYAARNHVEATGEKGWVKASGIFARVGSFWLNDIGFSVPIGSTLGIIGPSGSGKSLLLRTLAGIVPAEAGSLHIGTELVDKRTLRGRRIGFVFQDYSLYPNLTSWGNIAFPRAIGREDREFINAEVTRVASRLKIPPQYLERNVKALPEGIKQLVAIGRAEDRDAAIFLMDEPLKHLDPGLRREMRAFLSALRKEAGVTTIYAFNDPEDAMSLSEYILVLLRGCAVQCGTAREVFERPISLPVMELLSMEGVNALRIEMKNGSMKGLNIRVPLADGDWLYCFRPEEVEESDGPFRIKVESSVMKDGNSKIVTGRLQDGSEVRCVAPNGARKEFTFTPTAPKYFRT
jgi:multiple sugar transport system ATP-binding protein